MIHLGPAPKTVNIWFPMVILLLVSRVDQMGVGTGTLRAVWDILGLSDGSHVVSSAKGHDVRNMIDLRLVV